MAAVAGFINVALNTIQNILQVSQFVVTVWLFQGGWMYAVRAVEFFIDCKLVNFIEYVYKYFILILEKDMFSESVVNAILGNIYLFIGVIVFFRLMMVVIKYLVNPDLVEDAKTGVNSLIKRCVIGMCGILLLPTIFDIALELQRAILTDQLIQKIIIPNDMIDAVGTKINDGGRVLGTYVLAGFVSPKSSAKNSTVKEYKKAINDGNLSAIDINEGGWMANASTYEFEYFIIVSTVVLGYVFWQILKYTLDLAVRAFKLLIYQILAPVAMIEYIINGSDDGVFKSWKSATLGTYFMIFVRVMAIWFVMFVTILMSEDLPGYAGDSLLDKAAGTSGGDPDYLLRAIIIIALLGFMMDLPKIIGQIFGLDLEQETSATGVLQKVGNSLKGAAIGGLAIGGAMAGSALGTAKAGLNTMQGMGKTKIGSAFANKLGLSGKGTALKDKLAKNKAVGKLRDMASNFKESAVGQDLASFKKSAENNNMMQHMKTANAGLIGAVMGSNQFTGSAYKGYQGQSQEHEKIDKEAKSSAKAAQEHAEIVGNQKKQLQNQEFDAVMNVTARMADTGMQVTAGEVAARVRPTEVAAVNANIQGQISGIAAASISASDVQAGGKLSSSAEATVRRDVEEIVTRTYQSQGVDTSLPAVQQQINQQVDQVMGSTIASVDTTGTVTLKMDTSAISASAVGLGDQTITQVVNQVQGTKVGAEQLEATQIINQKLDQVVTNTEEMNVYAEISTEHIENMRQQVEQQINIQREINDEVKVIQSDARAQTNIQRNQVKMVNDIKDNIDNK